MPLQRASNNHNHHAKSNLSSTTGATKTAGTSGRIHKAENKTFVANLQQEAAIAHTSGPAAFIAAAGTGKTSILVQRLVRLIADEEVEPESILCVTFTRAAADEMEKRALKALKGRGIAAKDVKGLRVVTFHGLGHQMLREKLQWKPQELNARLLNGEPRQWLAEDILRPWRSNRTRGMNWEVEILDVLDAVDRAKEGLVRAEQSSSFFRSELVLDAELAERYQEFFVRYEETKQKEKLYDLSDLIYVPLLLLENSPKFRKSWQERYLHLQVDETQDTNPSQYRLIQYLAAGHHNVVVVGDPDQAIYQFRGASPEASILSFRTMYPEGKIYRIEHNYRSTPQILEAANCLISHNEVTPGFEKQLRPTQTERCLQNGGEYPFQQLFCTHRQNIAPLHTNALRYDQRPREWRASSPMTCTCATVTASSRRNRAKIARRRNITKKCGSKAATTNWRNWHRSSPVTPLFASFSTVWHN